MLHSLTQKSWRGIIFGSPESWILNPKWRAILASTLDQDNLVATVIDEAHVACKWRVWLLTSTSEFISTSAQFEAAEPVHNKHHNQMLCDWLTGTPMILCFRQPPPPPPPPREIKRLLIMPFQTLSTKQSEAAEFGFTRLGFSNHLRPLVYPVRSRSENDKLFSKWNLFYRFYSNKLIFACNIFFKYSIIVLHSRANWVNNQTH